MDRTSELIKILKFNFKKKIRTPAFTILRKLETNMR